jgi:hypothetical protein
MDKLASYRLSDFILFSESAYHRQFELYNQAIWPLHILIVIISLVILYVLWQRPRWCGRFISAVLMVSWTWVAYAYLYQRFYQIHVVAHWYALAFVIQAFLIARYGLYENRLARFTADRTRLMLGYTMLSTSLLVYPFIAAMTDRSWNQSEMFVLCPDPTAIATLGILLLYRTPVVLFVIPVLWLLISITTQMVM